MTHPGDPELLALLFDATEAAVALDDEGHIVRANAGAADFFGHSAVELVGMHLNELAAEGAAPPRPGSLPPGETRRGELRVLQPDGTQTSATFNLTTGVAPDLHMMALQDIGGQARRIESSLRASEALFARSFLGAPVAISVSNAKTGNFVLVNEEFLTLTGYWRSDVIGRTAEALHLWTDPADRQVLAAKLAAGDPNPSFRTLFRRKSGEEVEAWGRISIVDVAGQSCVVTAAFVVD